MQQMAEMLACYKLFASSWQIWRQEDTSGFSLLSVIRCQTNWISLDNTHDTVPPTYEIKRRNSSQSSSLQKDVRLAIVDRMATSSPISYSWHRSYLILYWRRSLYLTTLDRSWLASMILWKLSSSLGGLDRRPWLRLEANYWMESFLTWPYMSSPTCAAASTRTWVNQLVLFFRERSFVSLSLLDVFSVGDCLCLLVCVEACLFCFSKTSGFLLFTCSLTNWE